MNGKDRAAFAEMWAAVGEFYDVALTDARLEMFFTAMADLELAEIRAALNAHMRNSEFFPKPAEIRRALVGTPEDAAALAWVGLLAMVRRCGWAWNSAIQGPLPWPDEATKRAALELYGGWAALCERLPSEGAGLAVAAKHFQQTYSAYARRDQALLAAEDEPRELSADEARAALAAVMARPENAALVKR